MTLRLRFTLVAVLTLAMVGAWSSRRRRPRGAPDDAQHAAAQPGAGAPTGQTATLLPDGRWLLLGGVGAERSAILWDPRSGAGTPAAGKPELSRAFHTATVLADGTVLVA